MVKNLPDNKGDTRDVSSVSGSGRSTGEGNGYPLQYSCLENSMDRGACWAMVPGVAKNQKRLQKTKIMASGPITSQQIDGETVETVADFIFLG